MDILKKKTKHEKPEEQEVLKWTDILKEILNDVPRFLTTNHRRCCRLKNWNHCIQNKPDTPVSTYNLVSRMTGY